MGVLKSFYRELENLGDGKNDVAKDAWTILGGETRSGVAKQALLTFVQAIASASDNATGGKENQRILNLKSIGRYNDQGMFVLSDEERRWLRLRYAQRILCTTLSCRRSSNPSVVTSANFAFTPHVSSRSNALAAVLKQKLLYNATQNDATANVSPTAHLHNQSISDILIYKQTIAEEYVRLCHNSK